MKHASLLVLFLFAFIEANGQDRRGTLLQPVDPESGKDQPQENPTTPDKSGKSMRPLMPALTSNSKSLQSSDNGDRNADFTNSNNHVDSRKNIREKGALGLISTNRNITEAPAKTRPTTRIESGLLKPAPVDSTSPQKVPVTNKPIKRRPTRKPSTLVTNLGLSSTNSLKVRQPLRTTRRPVTLLSANRKPRTSTTFSPNQPYKEDYKSEAVVTRSDWILALALSVASLIM